MFKKDLIKADSIAFISVMGTVGKCWLWSPEDMEMNSSSALYIIYDLVFQLPYLIKDANDGTNLYMLFFTMLWELEIGIYNN